MEQYLWVARPEVSSSPRMADPLGLCFPIPLLSELLIFRCHPTTRIDRTVFVGTFQAGLMSSTQGGQSLAQVASFPDNLVLAVAFSPDFASDRTVFAAGYHGLYTSQDGGSTWTYAAEPARIEENRSMAAGLDPPQEPPSIVYGGNWSTVTAPKNASTNTYIITGAPRLRPLSILPARVYGG